MADKPKKFMKGSSGKKEGGKLTPEDLKRMEAKARSMPKGEARNKLFARIALARKFMGQRK